jgi:hypothetical protein
MGNITLQKFYPANATATAAQVNANFTAVANSTTGINQENLNSEALIRDHFANSQSAVAYNKGLSIKHALFQQNGYYVGAGNALATDAKYHSITDTSIGTANKTVYANLRQEINHNSSGVASTQQGIGTKIPVGGYVSASTTTAEGIALEVGDVIHVFWSVNAWRFQPDNATLNNYVCELIDSTSVISTILNYAMVVVPEFNTQDALGSNSNFTEASDATYGFTNQTMANPDDGVAVLGGGGGVIDPATSGLNNLMPFHAKRFDHWTWIPVMMGSAGNLAGEETTAVMMDAVNGANEAAIGEAKLCNGQTYITCTQAQTLYSIQLYITGLMGLHYDTSTSRNGTFIEDKAVTNSSGGIDGELSIERCSIGYVVYRKEGV